MAPRTGAGVSVHSRDSKLLRHQAKASRPISDTSCHSSNDDVESH